MRIAPYYRVSKDRTGNISIEVQREACERWVRSHADPRIRDAELLPAYIDDGKSAYTDDLERRPAFRRLLADANAKHFDLVLVYKYDRFARKRRIYFQHIDELRERHGIEVKSATESDDWLSVGFNGLMAELYSRMLSARMKDVRAWEVQQRGLHVGRVPVGYSRQHGLLVPNADAAIVHLLGQLYATGQYSAVGLAEELNARGCTMPGGTPFKATGIKEMLICPVYAGFVTHQGECYPGVHEPIWDAELWARIRAVHGQRSYIRSRPGQTHHALLTGIAFCAHCGGTMSHHPHNCPEWRRYRCQVGARRMVSVAGLTCRSVSSVNADAVERAVLAWLSGLSLTPALVTRVQQRLAQPVSAPSRDEIAARLRRLARAYGDGGYTDAEYERARGELLAQLDRCAPTVPDLSAVTALLTDLPTLLAEALPIERRVLARQLVSGVYLYRDEVRALRPTRAAEVFFQAVDPGEWLTIVQDEARRASNDDFHYLLKRAPHILTAS